MPKKTFPIMLSRRFKSIPWSVIASHEQQAQINHGQSLERLAERGGLASSEAVVVIENRRRVQMSNAEADMRLAELVAAETLSLEDRLRAFARKLAAEQFFGNSYEQDARDVAEAVAAETKAAIGRALLEALDGDLDEEGKLD